MTELFHIKFIILLARAFYYCLNCSQPSIDHLDLDTYLIIQGENLCKYLIQLHGFDVMLFFYIAAKLFKIFKQQIVG